MGEEVRLGTSVNGLSAEAAAGLLAEVGPSTVAVGPRQTVLRDLFHRCRNPLVIQLFIQRPDRPANGAFVLVQDADWGAAMEKENHLGQRLAGGTPFLASSRQVFVMGTTAYPAGRVLCQCVAISTAP